VLAPSFGRILLEIRISHDGQEGGQADVVQAVCEGRDAGDLATMEDPAALAQIKDLVTPQ
jgi:hypothetical protein